MTDVTGAATNETTQPKATLTELIRIPAGDFAMGSESFYPDEAPIHRVHIEEFELEAHPVTNAQFAAFVEQTGYVTVAERPLDPADFPGADPADLVPGGLVFTGSRGPVNLADWRQWWSWGAGASWRHPYGPESSVDDRPDHPVVQVAYEDAAAYAAWAGRRLPTEEEWEYAARGGTPDGLTYAWGDEPRYDGKLMANTWQGRFPYLNTGADGWVGTSPVGAFPPNGYGLVDMIGNVWEWTCSYYTQRHEVARPLLALADDSAGESCGPGCACGPSDANAARGEDARRAASAEPGSTIPRRALKGGSHLCAPEYCLRYRPAARSPQSEDSATTHIGFRCAGTL